MTSATSTAESQASNVLNRLVSRPLFWILFFAAALGIHIGRAVSVQLPKPLPVLSKVAPFQLESEQGRPFGSNDLNGKVWIANFVFTRCPTVCPVSTQKMAQIQHRTRGLGERFHLVSFTVDPEHDTAEKLRAFSKTYKASPRVWSFLTGSREALLKTLVDSLKVHMTREGEADDLMGIGHSNHFVLVDAQMQVRGYYDMAEPGAVDAIIRDAGLLANRGG